jgi:hypothetical protein
MENIQLVEDDNGDSVTVTMTGPEQDEQPAVVLVPEPTVVETPTPDTNDNENGEDGNSTTYSATQIFTGKPVHAFRAVVCLLGAMSTKKARRERTRK